MKKTNIILAAIVLLLTVSCNRKVEFDHETFITLQSASYSISESISEVKEEGDEPEYLKIPVTVYNPNGSMVQAGVEGIDGEGENGALEGVDYEIVYPSAGVLTLDEANNYQDTVKVAIKKFDGLTGTKNFQIRISSLTRGINVGGYDEADVRILDDDHPLSVFIGHWTGTLIDGMTGMSYQTEFNIEAVEGNYSRLRFDSGLDPVYGKGLSVKFLATADDLKKPTKVDITSKQLTGYENFFISGLEEDEQGYMNFTDFITFALNNDGSLSIEGMYGIIVPNEEAGGYALAAVYMGGSSFVKK